MVNFNPGRGSEKREIRPALVIQNDTGNIYAATTIVAAITSTLKEFPVTVIVSPGEGGLKQRSMVNLAQLLTIDRGRLQKRLGQLGDAVMERITDALRVSLDV
jgi:mRNA interferase MazF